MVFTDAAYAHNVKGIYVLKMGALEATRNILKYLVATRD